MNYDQFNKSIARAAREALQRAGIAPSEIRDISTLGQNIFMGRESCDNITFELKALQSQSADDRSNELSSKPADYGIAFYASLSHTGDDSG